MIEIGAQLFMRFYFSKVKNGFLQILWKSEYLLKYLRSHLRFLGGSSFYQRTQIVISNY